MRSRLQQCFVWAASNTSSEEQVSLFPTALKAPKDPAKLIIVVMDSMHHVPKYLLQLKERKLNAEVAFSRLSAADLLDKHLKNLSYDDTYGQRAVKVSCELGVLISINSSPASQKVAAPHHAIGILAE